MLKSLRVQIVLFILAVVLSTAAMLSVFVEYRSRIYFLEVAGNGLSGLARSTALEFDRQLAARKREVEALAAMPDFRASMLGGCGQSFVVRARLQSAANHTGAYQWIGLADKRGKICVTDSIDKPLGNIAGQAVFEKGMAAPWMGDSRRPDAAGNPVWGVDIAAPVLGPDNTSIGVVVARLDRRWIGRLQQQVLQPLLDETGASAVVLNSSGQVLMVSGEADLTKLAELDIGELRSQGLRWRRSKDSAGRGWVRGFGFGTVQASSTGWAVILSEPIDKAFAQVYAFRVDVLAGTVFFLLISLYFSVPVSRWLTQPIQQLSDAASAVQHDRNAKIARVRGIRELEQLSDALQSMVASLTHSEHALIKARGQAYTDPLTGLHNRRSLEVYIADLQDLATDADRAAFIYIDLDRFKLINDTHGHAAGDAVLRQVAKRMHLTFRESDLLVRLGGDEFVVVVHYRDESAPDLVMLSDRLVARIREPIAYNGQDFNVSCSIGIAQWDGAEALEAAMHSADEALYQAKAAGRDCVVFSGEAPAQ